MRIFCNNCGEDLPATALTCTLCGKPVGGGSIPQQQINNTPRQPINNAPLQPINNAPHKKAPRSRNWTVTRKIVIAIALIVFVAVAAIVVWFTFFNNPKPTPQEMIDEAMRARMITLSLDSYEIIGRDTDHKDGLDTITYRGKSDFPFMSSITTGTLTFEFNYGTEQWERYQDGYRILSVEENWDVNGYWVYSSEFSGDSFIDFELRINSFDGEILEGEYSFNGDYRLRSTHDIQNAGAFEMTPAGNMLGTYMGAEFRIVNFEHEFATATYEIFACRYNGVILTASNTTALGRTVEYLHCTREN